MSLAYRTLPLYALSLVVAIIIIAVWMTLLSLLGHREIVLPLLVVAIACVGILAVVRISIRAL
jgi:hypothetical protein